MNWLNRFLPLLKKYGFYIVITGVFLVLRGPGIWENFKLEGIKFGPREFEVLSGSQTKVVFPPPKGGAVAIFWASWCAPCKLEMQRLKASVESGKIPRERIFAINAFEDRAASLKFIQENSYPFMFVHAPEVVSQLKVVVTPTTAVINDSTLSSLSSGLSFVGIWRAEWLFR